MFYDVLGTIFAVWLIGLLPAYYLIKNEVLVHPRDFCFGGYLTVWILAMIWPVLGLSIVALWSLKCLD